MSEEDQCLLPDETTNRVTNEPGDIQSQESIVAEVTTAETEPVASFMRRTSWRQRVVLIIGALINFATLACFSMMAPFLPLEAQAKGISGTEVGIIFASFELVMVIFNVVFGRFLSAIGARFMYISGIFIAATCCILFGFLEWCPPGTTFFVTAIACRSVEGLGTAMAQTASLAIVANEFPDHVATVMGLLESFSGLGLMAGPAIGGVLYAAGGFFLPFVVMGSLFLLCGVVAFISLPTSIIAEPKDTTQLFLNFIKLPNTWVCAFCVTINAALLAFLDPIFSKRLASLSETLANNGTLLGLVFLLEPLLYALTTPVVGYFADKINFPLLLMVVGNFFIAISYVLMAPLPGLPLPTDEVWLTILMFSIVGIFDSFCLMPAFAAINKNCIDNGLPNDLDLYGLIAGFFGSAFNLGGFIGPLAGGALDQNLGFAWATNLAAIGPAIGFVVLAVFSCYTYYPRRPVQTNNVT